MQKFELDYGRLVADVLENGVNKITRNGITRSLFGKSLVIDNIKKKFPVLQGRKMFTKGIIGEFCAMVRQPKTVEDFKKWGCNYWELWAKENGDLNIDYGNEWFANGQIDHLKDCLKNNPNDRRMIITGWNPMNVKAGKLSLPCCHYNYQFYVAEGTLSMIWTQRSVDIMIGLPSDIVFAAVWLITLANEFGYKVGHIKMDLGDCHIYDGHILAATRYRNRVLGYITDRDDVESYPPHYVLLSQPGKRFEDFVPDDLLISSFYHLTPIKFELKA